MYVLVRLWGGCSEKFQQSKEGGPRFQHRWMGGIAKSYRTTPPVEWRRFALSKSRRPCSRNGRKWIHRWSPCGEVGGGGRRRNLLAAGSG